MISTHQRQLMGEINIIPLVDVVLVLLIIFMVTAPLLYRGMDLTLPESKTSNIKPEERFVLTIGKDRQLRLNEDKIALDQLAGRLQQLQKASLYLRADQSVPYGFVVHVIDMIKQAGIDRLGIVTEPAKYP